MVSVAAAPENEPVDPRVQVAVDRGLAFLDQQQDRDTGAWSTQSFGKNTAINSLAIMAFLARGHVPGQGPYGETINRGIDFVLSQQHPSGLISGFSGQHSMYDHGISTVMLCEVYGMVDEGRRKKLDVALAKAVKLILDAQKVRKPQAQQGGWRYTPTSTDSDLSVTGWQLMALRGAANVGATVPKEAIDQAMAYIRRSATPTGAFSYSSYGGRANIAMTGTGILSLELLGQHHSPEALAGGDFLLRTNLNAMANEHFFYAAYYTSQAANLLGGRYWDGIYRPLRESLLMAQRRSGAWGGGVGEGAYGEVYATSMAVLALTVPYRYLPLYQR